MIKVKFTYFKNTGKFYSEGELLVSKEEIKQCIYPKSLGIKLNTEKRLPGLMSGSWKYCFVCEPENLYPELIHGIS